MKTATQNLEDDHVHILQLIDVMQSMAERNVSNETDIQKVIFLIKNFADGFHHAKEENLLFPMMGTKGFSKEQGPIAVMLHDHVQGRKFVQGMENGLQLLKQCEKEALLLIYENMLGYGELLRNHIAKENNVLFRMADRVLSEEEQAYLLTEFSKVEENQAYKENIPEFLSTIEGLKMLYLKEPSVQTN